MPMTTHSPASKSCWRLGAAIVLPQDSPPGAWQTPAKVDFRTVENYCSRPLKQVQAAFSTLHTTPLLPVCAASVALHHKQHVRHGMPPWTASLTASDRFGHRMHRAVVRCDLCRACGSGQSRTRVLGEPTPWCWGKQAHESTCSSKQAAVCAAAATPTPSLPAPTSAATPPPCQQPARTGNSGTCWARRASAWTDPTCCRACGCWAPTKPEVAGGRQCGETRTAHICEGRRPGRHCACR